MLLYLLLAAFLLLLLLMVFWPRYISSLTSLACIVAAILIVLYLQENGLRSWYRVSPNEPGPALPPIRQQ